jgi:hypothetical protein
MDNPSGSTRPTYRRTSTGCLTPIGVECFACAAIAVRFRQALTWSASCVSIATVTVTRALSFGILGCDLHCGHCQNWISSQSLRDFRSRVKFRTTAPEQLVNLTLR